METAHDNGWVAERLEEIADLLEGQHANPFRVQAYRNAADTLRGLKRPVHELLAEAGPAGLAELPGIGVSLARTIAHLTMSGRVALLSQLRGESRPEAVLRTVPGIGHHLAERLHDSLGVHNLHELDEAAWDGRLETVPGFGPRRIQAIRETLAGRLRGHRHRLPNGTPASPPPPVTELLDVDAEYRRKAAADALPRIAPRRFNPHHEAWLPILHTHRGDRHYTVLFSNTARAHEFEATRDWVVIHRDDPDGGGQWTVITARFGRLRGQRVVRGRERECKSLAREHSRLQ